MSTPSLPELSGYQEQPCREREYWIEKTTFLDYQLKVNLDKIKINKPFPMDSSFCFGLSYTSIASLSVSIDALLFKKHFLSKILM